MSTPNKPATKIATSELQATLAQVLNAVWRKRKSFVITRHGVPIATLEPVEQHSHSTHEGSGGSSEESWNQYWARLYAAAKRGGFDE